MSNGNEHRKTLISCKVIRQNPSHQLKSTEILSFVITYLDLLFLYYVKRYSIPLILLTPYWICSSIHDSLKSSTRRKNNKACVQQISLLTFLSCLSYSSIMSASELCFPRYKSICTCTILDKDQEFPDLDMDKWYTEFKNSFRVSCSCTRQFVYRVIYIKDAISMRISQRKKQRWH